MAKKRRENDFYVGRLRAAALFAVAAFALLGVRLWYLQCLNGTYFRDLSENNRTRTVRTLAPRGMIYDREGRVIVRNRPAFNIEMILEDIPNLDESLEQLGNIVSRDPAELKAAIKSQRSRNHFEPKIVLADVSREELAKIKVNSYRLPGIVIATVPTRSYPFGGLAAQVLGYSREITKAQLDTSWGVRYVSGDIIGQAGIEKYWEQALRGESGFVRVEVDAMGNRKGELGIADDEPGRDLYLTIDLDLQRTAQEALTGKRGAVVALDPQSGEVLAIASSPEYDANIFSGKMAARDWDSLTKDKDLPMTNRAIASRYAPGSTFKLIVSVAALAVGKITPNTELYCPGYYFFAGRAYKCHKKSGHGRVSLRRAITVSCNAYFYQVGQMIGVDTIHKFATALGLGGPTGIDLPGEDTGLIPSSAWKKETLGEKWYEGETLSVAIGQGYVSVTPIQMALAMASIANGGTVYRPFIVRKIVDQTINSTEEFGPDVKTKLDVDPKAFETVRTFAADVVASPEGTGKRAQLGSISVGGKTGTAQVKALGAVGKSERFNDHAWFISFAPVEAPQIAMAVIVENSGHGGVAAAPVARQVLEVFFRKKGMLPPPAAEIEVPGTTAPPEAPDEPSEGTADDDEEPAPALPVAGSTAQAKQLG
jgi:penicillin-binding protein 2